MKKSIFRVFIALALIFNTLNSAASVRLPSILGSHMVLQQQSEVKLWGWCGPAERVIIKTSWDTITYKTAGGVFRKMEPENKNPGCRRSLHHNNQRIHHPRGRDDR